MALPSLRCFFFYSKHTGTLKFDMSSWSTLYLKFKNFKEHLGHGLFNVANQILLFIFDLY